MSDVLTPPNPYNILKDYAWGQDHHPNHPWGPPMAKGGYSPAGRYTVINPPLPRH